MAEASRERDKTVLDYRRVTTKRNSGAVVTQQQASNLAGLVA